MHANYTLGWNPQSSSTVKSLNVQRNCFFCRLSTTMVLKNRKKSFVRRFFARKSKFHELMTPEEMKQLWESLNQSSRSLTRSASLAKDNHLRWNLFGIATTSPIVCFFSFSSSPSIFAQLLWLLLAYLLIVVAFWQVEEEANLKLLFMDVTMRRRLCWLEKAFQRLRIKTACQAFSEKSPFCNLDVSEIELVKHRSRVNAFSSHF